MSKISTSIGDGEAAEFYRSARPLLQELGEDNNKPFKYEEATESTSTSDACDDETLYELHLDTLLSAQKNHELPPCEWAKRLLPPTERHGCPQTSVMMPMYREGEEIVQSVGSFLMLKDPALKKKLELLIVVDGHPEHGHPENETLRCLRCLLGLASDDPGVTVPGHFIRWGGYVNDIPFVAEPKK